MAVGQRASKIMRARGEKPGTVPSKRFGSVNVYPPAVLEQAFSEVSAVSNGL
jgi:hypothetical protein